MHLGKKFPHRQREKPLWEGVNENKSNLSVEKVQLIRHDCAFKATGSGTKTHRGRTTQYGGSMGFRSARACRITYFNISLRRQEGLAHKKGSH